MSRVNNKEKYKEYDHNYYIKHKRPKSKIGQAELKIADLEAKLAEKENEIKTLICDYESRITKTHELMSWLEHENEELKQQLTEKDKLLKCYQDEEKQIADILGDKDLTIIGSRVHLKNLIVELKNKIKDKDIVIEEKDKEIEHLKDGLDMCKNIKRYDIAEMLTENIKLKQNQNQLAIQELEKVKNFVDGRTYCADYINKRMQDLKGE